MKKKIRRRPPDEIKVIEEKKYLDMEHEMTEKQRKWFRRKPYGMGEIDEVRTQ